MAAPLQNNSDSIDYIIITPMRNEINTIRCTIESVLQQSRKPKHWLILSDGSNDGSCEVVEEYLGVNDWIRLFKIEDRGFDLVGQGVAQILNKGLELVSHIPSNYLVKLDADLSFESEYFEKLLAIMQEEKSLGIVSGHPYVMLSGQRVFERHSSYFPAGPARLYRRSYLRQIGPFVNSVGWDTVDILRMRVAGYDTKIVNEIPFHHMRPMGTRKGYLDGIVRDGRNAYLTGYSPLFFFCRALFNIKSRPYVLRTFFMIWGFFVANIKGMKRVVSAEEMKYHRRFQHKRLLMSREGRA